MPRPRRFLPRRLGVHCLRALVLAGIVYTLHQSSAERQHQATTATTAFVSLSVVQQHFPSATRVSDRAETAWGLRSVWGRDQALLGYVLQTSPQSDQILGFSGPTNTLLAVDLQHRILGISILSSNDTRDHVARVRDDANFMRHWLGRTLLEASTPDEVAAVSGATLTSRAIQQAISHRLGGQASRSLRFPKPTELADAQRLYPTAARLQALRPPAWMKVLDAQGQWLGYLLRTAPWGDQEIGYQGPTDVWLAVDQELVVRDIAIGESFDNPPYTGYVRDDEYFRELWQGKSLRELAKADLDSLEVEGVSGATMTSLAAGRAILAAAQGMLRRQLALKHERDRWWRLLWESSGTALVIAFGVALTFSRWRAHRWTRRVFQAVVILYLGLAHGDLISQAMLMGWAQHGLAWQSAGGLTILTLAAFAVPLASRHNAYCSHLCPHGAVQQLVKHRLTRARKMPRKAARLLRFLPAVLLVWCFLVGILHLPFSLVDIEPFDAWVFRAAGWATILVAVAGLIASLFVPMAYCRYGCPTGALLNHVRWNAASDRWTPRDWLAVLLLVSGWCILYCAG